MNADSTMLERDSLALLSWCWQHRGEHQTQEIIAEAIGASQQRVSYLINSVAEWGSNNSVLGKTASKYGYSFKLMKQPGQIIDVVWYGRVSTTDWEEWAAASAPWERFVPRN